MLTLARNADPLAREDTAGVLDTRVGIEELLKLYPAASGDAAKGIAGLDHVYVAAFLRSRLSLLGSWRGL